MAYLKLLAAIALLALITACATKEQNLIVTEPDHQSGFTPESQLVRSVLVENILPWHKSLEEDLISLHNQSQHFCGEPSSSGLTILKDAWHQAMHSWSSLAAINFGPIDDTNAAWRFQFWPDPLNYVHRKFKSRLKGYNEAISKDDLAAASIAIQGLSAMEYLLFDEVTQADRFYSSSSVSCKVLKNTAYNLMIEGQKLNEAWQTHYQEAWLSSLNDENALEKHKHYLEEILNGVLTNLILIKEKKLGAPLGLKASSDLKSVKRKLKPKYLESWRSLSSLKHLQSNLKSIEALYMKDYGFSWYLNQHVEQTKLDAEIKQQLLHLNQTLKGIDLSAFQQITEKNTQSLEVLYTQISHLYTLLRVEYMQTLNLHFRFNAHDGD